MLHRGNAGPHNAAVKMSREGKVVAHLVFSRETNFGQHLAILTARLVINASISKK